MTIKIDCEGKGCKWWHSPDYTDVGEPRLIPATGVCILYELIGGSAEFCGSAPPSSNLLEDEDVEKTDLLKAEAKIGELIQQEQKAGRLATEDTGRPNKCSISGTLMKTLKDYGLDRKDSMWAQQIYEHQNLIPVVVANAIKMKLLMLSGRGGPGLDSRQVFGPWWCSGMVWTRHKGKTASWQK